MAGSRPGGDRGVLEPLRLGPQGRKRGVRRTACTSAAAYGRPSRCGTRSVKRVDALGRRPVTRRNRPARLAYDRPVLCVAAGWEAGTTSHRGTGRSVAADEVRRLRPPDGQSDAAEFSFTGLRSPVHPARRRFEVADRPVMNRDPRSLGTLGSKDLKKCLERTAGCDARIFFGERFV